MAISDFITSGSPFFKPEYYAEYRADFEKEAKKKKKEQEKVLNVKDQQMAALSVLTSLRIHLADGTLIAGGGPRDWYFDKPARDVDVFIPVQCEAPGYYVEMVANILNIDKNAFINKTSSSAHGLNRRSKGIAPLNITHVANFKDRGVEFDVIFYKPKELNSIKEVLGSFDTSICQVIYDGQLGVSEEFAKDVENKTITVNIDPTDEKSIKFFYKTRAPKLAKKFPDYKIVSAYKRPGEVI